MNGVEIAVDSGGTTKRVELGSGPSQVGAEGSETCIGSLSQTGVMNDLLFVNSEL